MRITMKNQCDLTVQQGFNKFIRKCEVQNLSCRTIGYYKKEFARFISVIDAQTLLHKITSETIETYVIHLKENTQANDVTIASYMRAIRAIFYYLMKMGYMNQFQIIIPKAIKKVKETYTDEELKVLLKEYSEILITDEDDNLVASITDEDIVGEKDCKVVCVPIEN